MTDHELQLKAVALRRAMLRRRPPSGSVVTDCGDQMRAEHAPSNPDLYKNLAFGLEIAGTAKDEIERRQSATSESSPPPSQTFSTTLTVDPNNSPGLYTVRCTVIDHIGGGRQTQVANFSLP